MKKLYLLEKDRNEEEKRTGKASYQTIAKRFFRDMILCNNIVNVDEDLLYNIELGDIEEYYDYDGNERTKEEYEKDEKGDIYSQFVDIYQYYLLNINGYDVDYLKELAEDNNDNSIIIAYSNKLDCYVLLVTHFGTGWSYVPTNIALTSNIDESF